MKMRFLKYLMISLAIFLIDKAVDSSYPYMETDTENASEIRNPETNIIKTVYSSFSMPENQCRIPRQTNLTNTVRTLTQAHRNNHSSHSRHGYTLIKAGKSMNEYTTSLFFSSILNFPSGMNETNHHLISLRKLII